MVRVPDPDVARLAAPARDALAAAPDLAVFRAAAHAETVLVPWLETGRALLDPPAVPADLRELVVLRVAVSTRSDYVRARHEEAAAELGVAPELIGSVARGELDDATLGEAAPVLRSVEEIVRTHTVRREGLDALRELLGDRGCVEVLMLVGYYVGLSILASALDLPVETTAGK